LFYSLREGLDGFRRAKLASFISIVSMSFALMLVGVLAIVAVNLAELVDAVRSRIEFEVFVDNALDEGGIDALKRQIAAVQGIMEVHFISKAEAAEIFKRELARESGKDGATFLDYLDENPLPNSFRILLEKSYRNSVEAQRLVLKIEKLHGVDEVRYRRDLMLALDQYVRVAMLLGSIIGLVFCAGALILVINDIRLVIHAKRQLIEIMQLVGATRAFLRRPLLMQGFLQGALGGLIASGSLCLAYRLLLWVDLGTDLRLPDFLFSGLIVAGIFLGLIASYLGARKYIR
jgi:cell division transport system permease protein